MPDHAEDTLREVIELAEELFRQNREQWRLEDIAHALGIGVEELAKTKRLIDRSNSARTDKINRIDELVQRLGSNRTASPLVHLSETVGELVDRICILLLKEEHTADPAARDIARRKFRHLARCLGLTMLAMAEGRAVLPPSGIVKIYGPEEHGPS
jgi:hypothetical protein